MLAATEIVEGANTNINSPLAQKIVAGEKISLNVNRCRNRPACIAGVKKLDRPEVSNRAPEA